MSMELWELEARESIRDLVTRYNSNGDTGRIDHVLALFAADAKMETAMQSGGELLSFTGRDEIETIFTGTRDRWATTSSERSAPKIVRHCVFTHQIDLVDRTHARGRSYFQVLMAHGLDHWGRYFDSYEQRDGRWVFTFRRVTIDGRRPDGIG